MPSDIDLHESDREENTVQDEQAVEETSFKLGEFEGPLDLLLFLIKKNEVNIYDIPISKITEQYLEFLKFSVKKNLEDLTEFYVMASTLLYIKSKMLLPIEVNLEEEFEDPRQELVDRLIEYQKFKKLSEVFAQKDAETDFILERKKKQRVLPFPEDEDLWEELEVWDLLKSFGKMVKAISSERIINLFENVTVNEKVSLINEYLDDKGEFDFTDLIKDPHSAMEIICAFLAILESVKMRRILILQNRMFGDIRVKHNPLEDEALEFEKVGE